MNERERRRLTRDKANRRSRIIARLRHMVSETEQFIRDVEWWNNHRTDAPPFDCEWERLNLPVFRRLLAAWVSGEQPNPADEAYVATIASMSEPPAV